MNQNGPDFSVLGRSLAGIDDRLRTTERRLGSPRIAKRSPWATPSFQNSWANFGSGWEEAGYALDNDGHVHFKGLINSGADGTVCFTLPETLRPDGLRYLGCAASGGGAVARVDADGTVTIQDGTGTSNTWISLHGAFFDRKGYRSGDIATPLDQSKLFHYISGSDWDRTLSRQHLGGFWTMAGLSEFNVTPSGGDLLGAVPAKAGTIHNVNLWTITTGITPTRMYVGREGLFWGAGNSSSWISFYNLAWPDVPAEASVENLTSALSDLSPDWPDGVMIYQDSMGWQFINMIKDITTNLAVDDNFATLPEGRRPEAKFILPGMVDNLHTSFKIDTDGTIDANEAVASNGWAALSRHYWIDNG